MKIKMNIEMIDEDAMHMPFSPEEVISCQDAYLFEKLKFGDLNGIVNILYNMEVDDVCDYL